MRQSKDLFVCFVLFVSKMDDKSSNDIEKKQNDLEKCPCGQSNQSSYKLNCTRVDCRQSWHLDCVGLKGLPKPSIVKLEHWLCPFCYVLPTTVMKKDPRVRSFNGGSSLSLSHAEDGDAINQILKVVHTAVKEGISSSDLCTKSDVVDIVKENTTHAIKTYADVTATSQKKVLDEMSAIQASKSVVEEVTRKMDNDKIEREKRKSNVCVLGIKESTEDSAQLRNEQDLNVCVEQLGIKREDIDSCFRAGTKNTDPSFCRPLIIKMVNQETANKWTNNGRGLKTDHPIDSGKFAYLNADLCKADRTASFFAREEWRKRRNQRTRQTSAAPI